MVVFSAEAPESAFVEIQKNGEATLRTLCYVMAATVMIAVAAGMGKTENPADAPAQIQLAAETSVR